MSDQRTTETDHVSPFITIADSLAIPPTSRKIQLA
jgi:hypothetical protein